MNKWFYSILILIMILAPGLGHASDFYYKISPIPKDYQKVMEKNTWRPGCPVPLEDLAYIKLSYWGFDHRAHLGVLIVHRHLATEIVEIFRKLYSNQFPIERMQLMDDFKGDDNAAMKVNNTSAFNCRSLTNNPGKFSLHSYGYAVDINTLINPYVKNDEVLPPEGRAYLDRNRLVPGMIGQEVKTYEEFTKRGWAWGGSWHDLKDYQHFEKDCRNSGVCQ